MRHGNLHNVECFMKSIKSECLEKMIFFGDHSLRLAVKEFLAHYHVERNRQGLSNRIIEPSDGFGQTDGVIACKQRLGGLL